MGLFDKLESRLEHGVNGAFARAFKSEVQPVELAAGMRRAMDDRASSIGKGKRPIVPNLYTFELSPTDYERLAAWGPELDDELIAAAQEHADEQRYVPGGPFTIVLDEADDLETGVFRLRPTTAKAADAQAFAAQHPRQVRAAAAPAQADDEYDDYSDESYDSYDRSEYRDEYDSRNEQHEYAPRDVRDDRDAPRTAVTPAKPHGASRLDAYADDEQDDYAQSTHDERDEYARDDYAQSTHDERDEYARDDYVYDDEGDVYETQDDARSHTAAPVDPYATADPAPRRGGMGARIKNYLFGDYAPEPHEDHTGTDRRDARTVDAQDDYYPEHDADERAQADHTSYDDHYGDYDEQYEEQHDTQIHSVSGDKNRRETYVVDETSYEDVSYDNADDAYENEHTRPAPQKSASRPVRELPKKRGAAERPSAPVTSTPAKNTSAKNTVVHDEQLEDFPAEAPEREHHEGYISYDPEAEYTQRGGYTTYGEANDDVEYEEEAAPVRETRPREENRRPKRDQSRNYSHAWDDEDDDFGDPTGFEPAPSTPAPPARRATSPRERPWLKIDGQHYPLMGAITVIGRDDEADIILDDPGVSRRHSEVRITHDGPHLVMSIRDLGSTNGTYINGDRVDSEHLHDGDRLTVGRTSMTIHLGDRP